MADFTDRLMTLWQRTPSDDAAAEQAFAEFYTDPVTINGTPMTGVQLVQRARVLQAAFSDLRHQVIEQVETGDKLVVAFLLHGTHTGPWPTPLGPVAATGRPIAVRTIDVLTLDGDGRISEVVVVNDELGLLAGLGAVALTT